MVRQHKLGFIPEITCWDTVCRVTTLKPEYWTMKPPLSEDSGYSNKINF